jgi:hypothetical protein
MTGRNEDVVGPASELVADVDDEGVGDADGVDPCKVSEAKGIGPKSRGGSNHHDSKVGHVDGIQTGI